jgi:hypothetical protein
MTTLVWHRHRGPQRARFWRDGVEALLPVLASSRRTLLHRQECLCHTILCSAHGLLLGAQRVDNLSENRPRLCSSKAEGG